LTESPDREELYRAYSRSYATEANKRHIAFGVDLAFAVAALVLTVITAADWSPSTAEFLTTWLPLAALLWLVVRELNLLSSDMSHRRCAVNIQEQLDLTNWKGSAWASCWNRLLAGDPVPARTIKQLAIANPGAIMPTNYWVDTSGIPDNEAALFRAEQTAAWGAQGHHRYAVLNRVLSLVGLALVVVTALILDVSASETAAAVMAVAPFFVGRIQSGRAHASLADRRVLLEEHIQALLSPEDSSAEADVRSAQDELYRLRMEARRIPEWLYDRYAERDRASIDGAITAKVEEFRSRTKR
jgi:hypothetical protein